MADLAFCEKALNVQFMAIIIFCDFSEVDYNPTGS